MDDDHRTGFDRMDHPLSHLSAVVGAVAFVVFAGCMALLLSDSKMLQSTNWWNVFVLSASVITACLIGYFQPQSRVIYIPVLLAGIVTLGLCIWTFWMAQHPSAKNPTKELYRSLCFFSAWIAWAIRTYFQLRSRRQ